jgi:hypothetical protein
VWQPVKEALVYGRAYAVQVGRNNTKHGKKFGKTMTKP